MTTIRLAVRCRPEQAELVLAELAVLAPNGFEEEQGDGYVEYAIYGPEGELPDLGGIEAATGEGMVAVQATPIPDDWADRWQDFHQPLLVAGRVWIRPPWAEAHGEAIDVVIEPGQAFGTGAHATTRLCVELLIEAADRGEGGPLADLGTGSGVLAIVAARLGWDPVSGFDHEPAALEAATQNAEANAVSLRAERVNLREQLPPLAPTVVANLTAPLLAHVAAGIDRNEPPETLICSGLLASEADEVSARFGAAGLTEAERRQDGDWMALRLTGAARP